MVGQIADSSRLLSGIALATLTAGALTAAGLGGATTASASCASFFGIGNSTECSSNLTSIAIAIGTNAQAHADGLFGAALAVGNQANATNEGSSLFGGALAQGDGAAAFNRTSSLLASSIALGNRAVASSGGAIGMTWAAGSNTYSYTGGDISTGGPAFGNIAIVIGDSNAYQAGAAAQGIGNVAVSLFSPSSAHDFGSNVVAGGVVNFAANLFGPNSKAYAGYEGFAPLQQSGTFNTAFSSFSAGSTVKAIGPLSTAGSLFQTGATVTKHGPGFNINGVSVGGAAATGQPAAAAAPGAANAPRPTATGHRKPHAATKRRAGQ
ncbi:hypothetical protein [Mycobacterium sp. EPa45]|uniref:hypothetical protein n=1 Tax=Mycobacterium sp. EPa45 TaxID=1545728 RepID=UPI00118769D3|nr:hypothetical protein [Mycobacterium sp. EPa45]